MEQNSISFDALLIITLLATFIPVFLKKIKWLPIPVVVGEVIAGMIVGKSGFNLIHSTAWLDFLYSFGFAFLMFLSGLEVDFNQIKSTNSDMAKHWYKKPIALATIFFIGTISLSFIIAYILKSFNLIMNIPIITLIISTTSLGIVVPTLKEKGLLNTSYGQTVLLSALVADFMTMILVTSYVSFYNSAATYKVFLVFVLFIFLFIFYKMGKKIKVNKIISELSHATSQIKVRGAIALIVIFIALAKMLGTEIILGTFMAGIVVSLLDEREGSQLYSKLDAIGYGFFIPIFFIMVGANFDISYVIHNPKSILLLPALMISVYMVKVIPAIILKINYRWKDSLAAGALVSTGLSLTIATSAIGLNLGIISEETNGIIILTEILTCILSPLIFNKAVPAVEGTNKNYIYIIGVKQKTLLLAKRLKHMDMDITFITHNRNKYEKSIQQNYKGFLGDTLDVRFLRRTDMKKANIVVISKSDDEIALKLAGICKEEFGIKNIIILTDKQSGILYDNPYDATIISPELAAVIMAENIIAHPKAFSLLTSKDNNDFMLEEVYLSNEIYFDHPIRKIELPGDCLIVSILRNSEKIIPNGNTYLKKDDLIMLVGTKENVLQAKLMLKMDDS